MFAEAIEALRPSIVVVENVRGLLSATAHRTVELTDATLGNGQPFAVLRAAGAVLGDLADLGYDAQWATVAAGDVGAPHRRERVFILATHAGYRDESDRAWSAGWQAGERFSVGDVARRGGEVAAVSGDETGVALLPTPQAFDQVDYVRTPEQLAEQAQRPNGGGARNLREVIVNELPEPTLLSTPQARDFKGVPADNFNTANPCRDVANTAQWGFDAALGGDEPGVALLPTPQARDFKGTDSASDHNRHSPGMDAVTHHFPALLPTPSLSDNKTPRRGDQLADTVESNTHTLNLADAVEHTHGRDAEVRQWGKYAPAIARWEAIAGLAPAPTEPNKNGNPRLSAAFSEWLMGWPAGWVTDPAIGISRNDQLRIVGNGVCPQQAVAALRYLLAVTGGIPVSSTPNIQPAAELLPTPCVVDRLATTDMTLEQWDESRRSQKERGVGSFGPRGDSLGAAVLRVEEGTVDDRPDYSTRSKGR